MKARPKRWWASQMLVWWDDGDLQPDGWIYPFGRNGSRQSIGWFSNQSLIFRWFFRIFTNHGGLLHVLLHFLPDLKWGNDPIWAICFRWVGGSTHQLGRESRFKRTTWFERSVILSWIARFQKQERVVLLSFVWVFFGYQVAQQSHAYMLLKANEGRKGKVVKILVENCLQVASRWTPC